MELTPEERRKIYEEELEKRSRQKIQNVTPEEREKIFQEESQIHNVSLDSKMMKKPYISFTGWKFWLLCTIIMACFVFILGLFWGIIIGCISSLVLLLVAVLLDFRFIFGMIYFTCPSCSNDMHFRLDVLNKDVDGYYKKNQTSMGECPNCHREIKVTYQYIE